MSESFQEVFNEMSLLNIPHIGFRDLLDMVIVTFFLYKLISLVRDTRTWPIFRGVLFILAIAFLSNSFQLHSTWWIISNTLTVGIMALVVVFQPELRRALEQLGRSGKIVSSFLSSSNSKFKHLEMQSINEIARACIQMGNVCTGALIVIERSDTLSDVQLSGIPINATISSQLLINIFEKNTPLHDGSILIRNNQILSATCILPLSDNLSISKDLGTRHRAAIGISEKSDAVVVVVSEETGAISLVENGVITRNLDEFELGAFLKNLFIVEDNDSKITLSNLIKRRSINGGKKDS